MKVYSPGEVVTTFLEQVCDPKFDQSLDLAPQASSQFLSAYRSICLSVEKPMLEVRDFLEQGDRVFFSCELTGSSPKTGKPISDNLQNRWSDPLYLEAMSRLHQNLAARAAGLLLLKELVDKRKGVVVDAFEDGESQSPGESTDEFAQHLIDLWSFRSEDALDPLSADEAEFNEKCSFAMNFLLCILEQIQTRLKSGEFTVEETLVETLYVQMERYINAFSEFGKSPAEDVSKNQAVFAEVLAKLEG